MRVLPPALQDAARSGSAAPQVRLELMDATPHYGEVYSAGPAGRSAAALSPDGMVVQAYHDGARTVYARRVPDPTVADWGPWSTLTAGAAPGAGVALARLADRLRVLWQAGAATGVWAADSFDGGATWATGALLFDPGTLLCAIAADGVAETVFVAYRATGGGNRVAAWSLAGTWRGADWTVADASAIAGLGVLRRADGSFLLAVAVQASASSGTALAVYAYGGTWSPLSTLVPGDVDAGIAIAEPRLAFYDTSYHLAYAVVDSGALTGLAAPRTAVMRSMDGTHWTDPLEDAGTYALGATPLKHAAGYLLVAPDAAALASLYTGSATQYHDLSAGVSRLEVVQKDGTPARLIVTIQNGDALRGNLHGGVTALRLNATLRLSLGYAGAGVVTFGLFYIDDWSAVRAADDDEVVITASDASARLDRQSRATLLYSGQTVGWLAGEVAARAGLLVTHLPATAQFSYTVPTFAIPAGMTWRDALMRLSRLYGFDAAARVGSDGQEVFLIVEKSRSDAPVWDGEPTVEQSVVARSADRANHVLVFGAPAPGGAVVGEAWDWADVAETGQERYLHTIEPLITTRAGAHTRAMLEQDREARRGDSGSLSASLHPGLEVWDVITLGAGVTPLRIATLHHIYEPRRGVYDMALTCEGV